MCATHTTWRGAATAHPHATHPEEACGWHNGGQTWMHRRVRLSPSAGFADCIGAAHRFFASLFFPPFSPLLPFPPLAPSPFLPPPPLPSSPFPLFFPSLLFSPSLFSLLFPPFPHSPPFPFLTQKFGGGGGAPFPPTFVAYCCYSYVSAVFVRWNDPPSRALSWRATPAICPKRAGSSPAALHQKARCIAGSRDSRYCQVSSPFRRVLMLSYQLCRRLSVDLVPTNGKRMVIS